jgi:hypothetical protein
MMNPTLVHMNNYSPTEDGIATTTSGYFLPPNGWASVEPLGTYDSRVAMAAMDVQKHSPPTNVSLLHARPRNLHCGRRSPSHRFTPADICTRAVGGRRLRTIPRPIHSRLGPEVLRASDHRIQFLLKFQHGPKCACFAGSKYQGQSRNILRFLDGHSFPLRRGVGSCQWGLWATPDDGRCAAGKFRPPILAEGRL